MNDYLTNQPTNQPTNPFLSPVAPLPSRLSFRSAFHPPLLSPLPPAFSLSPSICPSSFRSSIHLDLLPTPVSSHLALPKPFPFAPLSFAFQFILICCLLLFRPTSPLLLQTDRIARVLPRMGQATPASRCEPTFRLVSRLRCFVPKQRHAECRADLNQGPGHTLQNVHTTNHQSPPTRRFACLPSIFHPWTDFALAHFPRLTRQNIGNMRRHERHCFYVQSLRDRQLSIGSHDNRMAAQGRPLGFW